MEAKGKGEEGTILHQDLMDRTGIFIDQKNRWTEEDEKRKSGV